MTDLPTEVSSLLGPVRVEMVEAVDDGDSCGEWHHTRRAIKIKKGLPDVVARHTLWHEIMHMILEDSGVAHGLTKKQEEAVCDAYATYKVSAL